MGRYLVDSFEKYSHNNLATLSASRRVDLTRSNLARRAAAASVAFTAAACPLPQWRWCRCARGHSSPGSNAALSFTQFGRCTRRINFRSYSFSPNFSPTFGGHFSRENFKSKGPASSHAKHQAMLIEHRPLLLAAICWACFDGLYRIYG